MCNCSRIKIDGPRDLNYKETVELGDLLTYVAKVVAVGKAKFMGSVPAYWKYKIYLDDCGERAALIWHV